MWTTCSCGQRHWGRYGAAGLLLTDPERTGVVLQKRSGRVHYGGTWSIPGGAIEGGARDLSGPPCARPMRRPGWSPTP
jgi:8-oxo-dGTP diphosphatase